MASTLDRNEEEDPMLYLASKLWIWLLLGAATGFLVAWMTCSERDDHDR